MGSGWRRAFCTTIPPRNSSSDSGHTPSTVVFGDIQQQPNAVTVPRKIGGFFKSYSFGSNPSTPSLRSRSINNAPPSLLDDDDNSNNTITITSSNSNSSTPRLGMGLGLRPNKKNIVDDDAKFHSSVIDNLNITPRLRCKTNTKNPKSNPSSPRSPFSIFKTSLGFSRSNCGLCSQSVKTGHKTAIFTAECSHTFHFPCISKHFLNQKKLACPLCKSTWRDASFLSIHDFNNNKQLPLLSNTDDNNTKENHVTRSPNFIKPKPYSDDEPLGTPRATSGIVPIPEAFNENEEDDNNEDDDFDEFKGFFANPVVSSSSTSGFNKNVEVMLISEVAVISSTQSHQTYALILKVKAPPPAPPNESRRAPIDLVAVLDVNASMGGPKLRMLKRAMRLVISSLASADRLSIVAFSASPPKRLLPLRRMTSKGQRSARRIIDHLASSTSTSTCTRFAGEALKKATQVLEDRREKNPVASIILLSDGHQADTNSNQRQLSSHVSSTRFAHVEIPVHTTPAGYNSTHDDHSIAEDAFTKCVGGLLSVVAQDLRVQLDVATGSDPAEITAVYSCNGKPMVLNAGSIRFGDLYAEEEREVLVEMRVPKSNSGSHHVLSARCSYNDPATQQIIYGGEKALLVPRAHTVRSSGSPKIERLRNLFIATRAVAESRLLVEYNNLTTAHHLLSSARALLLQSSMSGEEFVKGLESELVDVQWRVQYQQHLVQQHQQQMVDENGEPLTPTLAWRAAEKLAKVAVMNKSFSDLHGFENARF